MMGLAVLPARLKEEMAQLKEAVLAGKDLRGDENLAKHADWVEEFSPRYQKIQGDNIDSIIEKEIGLVFLPARTASFSWAISSFRRAGSTASPITSIRPMFSFLM